MGRSTTLILCLVAATAANVAAQGGTASSPSGSLPSFPALPSQYSTVIEVNIIKSAKAGRRPHTTHAHEWYDQPNDRSRIDSYHQAGRGRPMDGTVSTIHNYGTNRYVHTDEQGACTWGDTAHTPQRRFGPSNSAHLSNTSATADFFKFGVQGNMTEIYVGKSSARGITADVWRHFECLNGNCSTGNTSIEYFFSTPSWQLPEDGPPNATTTVVPLRVIRHGWRYDNTSQRNCSCMNCSQPQRWGGRSNPTCPSIPSPRSSWRIHPYYGVFDYVSFHVGPMDDHFFHRPCGKLCTSINTTWSNASLPVIGCPWNCGGGQANVTNATSRYRRRGHRSPSSPAPPPAQTGQNSMPALPNQFSAVIEANIVHLNLSIHMHEFYDIPGNRTRTDLFHGDTGAETTSIFDFANNHYWHSEQIAHRGSVNTCQWGLVDHVRGKEFRFWDMERTRDDSLESPGVSGSGEPHLTTSESIFGFGRELGETYDGKHSVRGIMSDKWSRLDCGKTHHCCEQNMTTSFYFSQAGWSMPEDNGERVPTRVEIIGSSYRNRYTRNCSCSDCSNTTRPIKRSDPNYNPSCHAIKNQNTSQWSLYQFHHIYDYVSFHVGAPADRHYSPPCNQTCTSYNSTYSNATYYHGCVRDQTCACNANGTCPVTRHARPPPPPTNTSSPGSSTNNPSHGRITHQGTANHSTGSAGGHSRPGTGSTGAGRHGSSQARTCAEDVALHQTVVNATQATVSFDVDLRRLRVGSATRIAFEGGFKRDMAALLGVDRSRIVIINMRPSHRSSDTLNLRFAVLPSTGGVNYAAAALTSAVTTATTIAGALPTRVNGSPTTSHLCTADVNSNAVVDSEDLLAVLSFFSSTLPNSPADFDGSGVVDVVDILHCLSAFGTSCSAPAPVSMPGGR